MTSGGQPAEQAGASLAPSPRANPDLLGREAAEGALRRLVDSGRMPHALLLCGPRGIGKATLAYRLARFVLAQASAAESPPALFNDGAEDLAMPPESGTFRRVAAGGHADLLTVERSYDPRRRRLRSEIVVDDTRDIAQFMRLTPAEGGWRVVVVDGADEMNRNAANALLKILEEPPQRALLLLVAHSPGRLLPTIRSRCRRFALPPLPAEIVGSLLNRYRPDVAAEQAAALVTLSNGSIGRALGLAAAGGIELYESLLALLSRRGGLDPAEAHAFADRLARGEAEEAYRAAEELLDQLLTGLAVAAARSRSGDVSPAGSDAALQPLAARNSASGWAELRRTIEESFVRTDALNLDRKGTILGALFAIDSVLH